MLFGHGSWNTFHADTKQVFRASGGEYATINKIGNGFQVKYSATKTGTKVQSFNNPSRNNLADARNFANQYEPTGKVIDLSDGQPRDAEVSEWSNWKTSGSCDLKRTRTVVVPAFLGGSTPDLEEIKPNHYMEDATVSAWSDWGECNDGTQMRTRTVTTAAKCGGSTPELEESRDCTVTTTDETTTTDDGTTITSDDEQDSIDTGDTTSSGTDDSTVTTQSNQTTIVSAGATGGMSTGKKVMIGVLTVGVIGGAVYYRAKKM
tara:strand:- start:255 stop:1040 length:786 start_codon:yes stop_codon:yes gene_type:complete